MLLQLDTELSAFTVRYWAAQCFYREILSSGTFSVRYWQLCDFTVRYWAQCILPVRYWVQWFYSEILSSVIFTVLLQWDTGAQCWALQWDTEFSAFIERYWFQCIYIEILSSVLLLWDIKFIAFTLRYGNSSVLLKCDTELNAFVVRYWAQGF